MLGSDVLFLSNILLFASSCQDTHDAIECGAWADAGECEVNPGFMKIYASDVLYEDPWILAFEHFLTAEEIAAFKRHSTNLVRSLAGQEESDDRTSMQMWCVTDPCLSDPLIEKVHQRVVNITGIPKEHAEYFQIVQYEPGQFYRPHQDQNSKADSLVGVRLSTFFLYLQTPEAGGATYFPKLGVKVQAEAGLALWWPNVRDDLSTDERTEHEAQSVHEGTKLTANLWLHEYDFRTPFTFGCNLDEVGASIQSDEL
ncbi:unnamed protein product [Durusdinium trenchii]|uniref:Fe2OG dioxygenase domain-containing protein n=1 Tax=Durusdinium trenchii TaxID=1381693 RepID=A0ABP0T226_9DINO